MEFVIQVHWNPISNCRLFYLEPLIAYAYQKCAVLPESSETRVEVKEGLLRDTGHWVPVQSQEGQLVYPHESLFW